MAVLICCEESQAVCLAFRRLGVEAFSNDLKPCSGGYPQWHIIGDGLEISKRGFDLIIAHPPCTHIAVSGAKHFEAKRRDGRQAQGVELFMRFTELPGPWCIENPVSIMSKLYRKPNQIIQPYHFGDTAQKSTCLWLKGLPPLFHSDHVDLFNQEITHVEKGDFVFMGGKKFPKWYAEIRPDENRGTIRSKTFPGIANAMAKQWSQYLNL